MVTEPIPALHMRFLVSAVTQNRPLRVEIKGFKTGHCLGVKTALKVSLHTTIYSLADRGWSQRRIARELGINRETVGRYLRLADAKPAISTPGSDGDSESKPAILTPGVEGSTESKLAISPAGKSVGRKSQC